jgi:hypothetical protein
MPRDLEQHARARVLALHVMDGVRIHEDERQARVVGATVALASLVPEPGFPVGLVELADLLAVLNDAGGSANRDPLLRPVVVIAEGDVRVALQLVDLVGLDIGDEPEIGECAARLRASSRCSAWGSSPPCERI